jgi:hypothetical protein
MVSYQLGLKNNIIFFYYFAAASRILYQILILKLAAGKLCIEPTAKSFGGYQVT